MGLALLIPQLHLLMQRPWLTRDEYLRVVDAQSMLDQARAEAQRIVKEAADQAEAVRDAAHEQGLAEGRAAAAGELASAAAGASRVLLQLRPAIARTVAGTLHEVLDDLPPEKVYAAALRRASRMVRGESFMTLRVPPGKEAAAAQAVASLTQELGWEGKVDLRADATLPDHACVLESAAGKVSCGMDVQLRAVAQAVEREVAALAAFTEEPHAARR
jgi:type III secretion protein L